MIAFSHGALDDLERIFRFHEQFDPHQARRQISTIESAILILNQHPRIGRLAESALRELLISVNESGFVALYQYDELDDVVRIVSIRHQREAGYLDR